MANNTVNILGKPVTFDSPPTQQDIAEATAAVQASLDGGVSEEVTTQGGSDFTSPELLKLEGLVPKPVSAAGLLADSNLPVTKSQVDDAVKTVIGERSQSGQQKQIETVQQAQERVEADEIFGGITPAEAARFEEVPVGRTEKGQIRREFQLKPEFALADDLAKIHATAEAKTEGKLLEGQRAAERSLQVISTTLNDFSKVLAGAYDEGGFGDIIKASTTALRQKYLGGIATKGLVETGKIPGKKTEIITKMMPLLTQQGDKPGSVRLVSTVFERLSDSLPGANQRGEVRGNDISLEEARGQMEATIRSMFRFAQAIKTIGLTNDSVKDISDKDMSSVGDLIEDVSKQFFVEGSEEEARLNEFIGKALAPLDKKILEVQQRATGGQEVGLSEEEQGELLQIDEELARLRSE